MISYEVGSDYVTVGSTHWLSPTHQLGATIAIPAREGTIYRMKGKNGQVGRRFVRREKANHQTKVSFPAHSSTIPARPFIGISAQDEANIFEDVQDWLTL
ncbi:MAG: phage virion morphogenesis protein [Pseudorhodobacter sp.]|nr:phage virion morphogenesis protein [Pseudorhodobacter sp.]MDN5788507.1 phage virion morphogenesis protein [Pseudorhodobacter sp.]